MNRHLITAGHIIVILATLYLAIPMGISILELSAFALHYSIPLTKLLEIGIWLLPLTTGVAYPAHALYKHLK